MELASGLSRALVVFVVSLILWQVAREINAAVGGEDAARQPSAPLWPRTTSADWAGGGVAAAANELAAQGRRLGWDEDMVQATVCLAAMSFTASLTPRSRRPRRLPNAAAGRSGFAKCPKRC